MRLQEVRRFLRLSPLDQNRMVMFSDVGIVEARFRFRRHQVTINRNRHIEVTVNSAVNKFDFENVTPLAIANFADRR